MGSNTVSQIYLRDLQTSTTTLISKTAPAGEPGNGESSEPVLAGGDGCEVAFESAATNLYPGANTSAPQIYLTDICSTPASTILVSRADGAQGAPLSEGGEVPLPLGASANGRDILFAATLDAHSTGAIAKKHLYLRDLDTGHTTLIDRASGLEGEAANQSPEAGAISATGCRVAFVTRATNLTAQAPPLSEPFETYIRQLAACQIPAGEDHEQATEPGKAGEQPNASGQPNPTTATTTSALPALRHNVVCVVPAMRALKLAAIIRTLHAAHCTLGRIAHHYNAIPKGELVEQSLHLGTIRPAGTNINIWLSKGRHHKQRAHRRKCLSQNRDSSEGCNS